MTKLEVVFKYKIDDMVYFIAPDSDILKVKILSRIYTEWCDSENISYECRNQPGSSGPRIFDMSENNLHKTYEAAQKSSEQEDLK